MGNWKKNLSLLSVQTNHCTMPTFPKLLHVSTGDRLSVCLSISKGKRTWSLCPSRVFLKASLPDSLGKAHNLLVVSPAQGTGSIFPLAVDPPTLQKCPPSPKGVLLFCVKGTCLVANLPSVLFYGKTLCSSLASLWSLKFKRKLLSFRKLYCLSQESDSFKQKALFAQCWSLNEFQELTFKSKTLNKSPFLTLVCCFPWTMITSVSIEWCWGILRLSKTKNHS